MIVKQKIIVTKTTGVTTSFSYLNFLVDTSRCRDLEQAIKQANHEYMKRKIKSRSSKHLVFNWLDFWDNVPNELCWKYGFQKDFEEMPTLHVNCEDTQLFLLEDIPIAVAS